MIYDELLQILLLTGSRILFHSGYRRSYLIPLPTNAFLYPRHFTSLYGKVQNELFVIRIEIPAYLWPDA